jgi:UTP--glucose-1-phosphate uridylyltransferase
VKPIRKAILPVGGLGTRFLPATKSIPKEMLPVVDKPLIQYAVEEARDAGIEQFIFVTGHGKDAIQNHFDPSTELEQNLATRGKEDLLAAVTSSNASPGEFAFVRQMWPLGLGHAVWCARTFIGDDPFAVLLPDDLILGETEIGNLVTTYEEQGGNVISLMEVDREETSRYGIVTPASDDGHAVAIDDLVEKPHPDDAPSNLAIVGRYILQPEVMAILGRGERGQGGEIQLTDGLKRLVDTQPFHGVRLRGTRFDCGSKIGFLEANVAFALGRDDLEGDVRDRIAGVLERF